MRKIGLLLALIWIISVPISAQENKDFIYYNTRTYELYEAKQWNELIPLAKAAIRNGFDFYYLRMRLGIAYYELQQYGEAAPHFYRALQWNPHDPLTQEYLYYSLVFSGRASEARLYEKSVETARGSDIGVFASGVYKWSDQRSIVDDLENFSIGLRHTAGPRVTFLHTYDHLRQYFVETIEVEGPGQGQGNGQSGSTTFTDYRYDLIQQAYRLTGLVQLQKGWQGGISFQHLWGEVEGFRYNEQAVLAHLWKAYPRFKVGLEGGYANYSQSDHYQLALHTVIYPQANTDWYYQAGALFKEEGGEMQHWISQRLGVRLAPFLLLEGLYDFGEINYFQDSGGIIAYNIADPLRSRFGGNLQYWINGRHLLFVQYQLENKTFAGDLQDYSQRGLVLGVNINF